MLSCLQVTIEKGQGEATHVPTPYAEDNILSTAQRVKALDPTVHTVAYFNSVLDWNMCVCVCVYACVRVCVCACACMFVSCMPAFAYVPTHVFVSAHVRMFVYVVMMCWPLCIYMTAHMCACGSVSVSTYVFA